MAAVHLGIRRIFLATALVGLIGATARTVDQPAQAESSQEPTMRFSESCCNTTTCATLSSNSIQQSELMKSETRAASCMRDRLCNWITALQTQKCS